MIVRQLTWLSKVAREAELIISDGEYECIAFSHPCNVQEGDSLHEPLHAFVISDLMISSVKRSSIALITPGGLKQRCIAKVIDIENRLVEIGRIIIALEEQTPSGALCGDYVEFICARLDVW